MIRSSASMTPRADVGRPISPVTVPLFLVALSQFAPVILSRSWTDPDYKEALFDNSGLVIGGIVTATILGLYALFSLFRRAKVRYTWADFVMLVWGAWACVSLVVGYLHGNSLLYWAGDFWQVISLPVAYFATRRYLANKQDADSAIAALLWACGIFVLYNLLRTLLTLDVVYVRFGGAIGIYLLLTMLLPVMLGGSRASLSSRVFFAAAALSLLLTGARFNMVVFAVMFLSYWAWNSFVKRRLGLSAVLIVIASLATINLVRFEYQGRGFENFLIRHFDVLVEQGAENYTVTYRMEEAKAAYRQLERRERVLLGEGVGGVVIGMRDNLLGGSRRHYLHILPAAVLFRMGVIGLAAFIALIGTFLVVPVLLLWRHRHKRMRGRPADNAGPAGVLAPGTFVRDLGHEKLGDLDRLNVLSAWLFLLFNALTCLKDSSSVLQNGILLGIDLAILGFVWARYKPVVKARLETAPVLVRRVVRQPVPTVSLHRRGLGPDAGSVH